MHIVHIMQMKYAWDAYFCYKPPTKLAYPNALFMP